MSTTYQARDKLVQQLNAVPGIRGIGVTWDDKGRQCLRVNVDPSEFSDEARKLVPKFVDSYRVLIETILNIKAARHSGR